MLEIFDPQHTIRAHRDHFEEGTSDVVWMRALSEWPEKPVVVSGDNRILKNSVERQALKDAQIMMVFLAKGWTNLRWEEFAWRFVKGWPGIVQATSVVRKPSGFEVKVSSLKVELRGALANL